MLCNLAVIIREIKKNGFRTRQTQWKWSGADFSEEACDGEIIFNMKHVTCGYVITVYGACLLDVCGRTDDSHITGRQFWKDILPSFLQIIAFLISKLS